MLQTMMKFEQSKARAKTVNKVALETEKEKDTAEKRSGRTETTAATKETTH